MAQTTTARAHALASESTVTLSGGPLPTLSELEAAATLVHNTMPPTPQFAWPLLKARCGAEVWVKHENHTPIGAFKVRGGLVYFDHLRGTQSVKGVVCATRGNHGQSVAFAAQRAGIPVAAVVPHGNSVEKNAAMRALGAEVIESGHDFQSASDAAATIAQERGWHRMPSFHHLLVRGVGTYALELFQAVPDLEAVYVPIGLGSGICGVLAARDALGLPTRVIGVVSTEAPAYALSFERGHAVEHDVNTQIADGVACRTPNAEALALILRGVDHIVSVTDAEVEEAMRALYTDTHNVAEGAGAAGLAALLQERDSIRGQRVAVILSGGNVDSGPFTRVLAGPA